MSLLERLARSRIAGEHREAGSAGGGAKIAALAKAATAAKSDAKGQLGNEDPQATNRGATASPNEEPAWRHRAGDPGGGSRGATASPNDRPASAVATVDPVAAEAPRVARGFAGEPAGAWRRGEGFACLRTRFEVDPRGAGRTVLGGALAGVTLPGARELASCLTALCGHCRHAPDEAERASPTLFLDLETTGLGGAGAVPFVVGLAHAAIGGDAEPEAYVVEQWCLERLSAEGAMLADLAARVRELAPRHLVSFNGASFDLPLLRRRFALHGVATSVLGGELAHVDLLAGARRLWRDRVRDCRLATLEREKLGLRRRGDLPGHEVPEVFWAWLRAPDSASACERMAAVRVHNQVDLVALPALARRLAVALREPGDLAERLRGARHLQGLGDERRALELLAPALEALAVGEASCELTRAAGVLAAQLLARAHRHDEARGLWHTLCRLDPGNPLVHEALAKDLEHRAHDPVQALRIAAGSDLPCSRRVERLRRKVRRLAEASPTVRE